MWSQTLSVWPANTLPSKLRYFELGDFGISLYQPIINIACNESINACAYTENVLEDIDFSFSLDTQDTKNTGFHALKVLNISKNSLPAININLTRDDRNLSTSHSV